MATPLAEAPHELTAFQPLSGLRDRLLTNPRFLRWATRFPLTRPIARRRARELFDLCAGFVYSQILFACVRSGLFERLAAGPRDVADLARDLALPVDAMQRLLDAAVALRLVEARGAAGYGLGTLGAAVLGNPGVARMVEHHALLYEDLRDPLALLRGEPAETGLSQYWGYATAERPDALTAAEVAPYSALMAASQPMIADEVLDAYPFRRHRRVMDVGGGDGMFLSAVAARLPHLRLILFDLPPVVAQARTRFAAQDLAGRATCVGGDFLSDPLPADADLVTLVRVLHDHDNDAALALLRAIRRSLPESGSLLVAEPMAGTNRAEPIGAAYFGFYLLAMRRGRPRTPAAVTALLHSAGFGRVRPLRTRTPMLVSMLHARP